MTEQTSNDSDSWHGRIAGIAKPVSRWVQGCMMLSDRSPDALEQSFRILDDAFEQGVTCFDNGAVYGGGRCERVFGRWLQERGNRDQIVILDKGCHHDATRRRVTPLDIDFDVETSLDRLGVGHIDLWMFHRDDESQPVGPLVEALNAHLDAGRISAIGASNWRTARIEQFDHYAAEHGLIGLAASSPNFSLARQLDPPWEGCVSIAGPENAGERQWYVDSRLPVFTWSSLARGFLSGRITRANVDTVRAEFEEHVFRSYECEDNWERLERAARLADRRGLTVAQIALAFALGQDFDAYTLAAAYTREEAAANAAAVRCALTADERAWLDLATDTMPA